MNPVRILYKECPHRGKILAANIEIANRKQAFQKKGTSQNMRANQRAVFELPINSLDARNSQPYTDEEIRDVKSLSADFNRSTDIKNMFFNSYSYKLMIIHNILIASEESFLLSHMATPKNAIKSLILVLEQFCIEHFLILFQF